MSGPLVQAIGWALLHLVWQGTIVAAILAAVLALLRKQSANVRYLVSCAALALVVLLGVVTAVRLYEPRVDTAPAPSIATAIPIVTITDAPQPAPSFDFIGMIGAHLAEIVAIWLIGVLVLSARLFAGWIAARRLARRDARVAGEQWQRSLWRIASTLRLWRPIDLLESAAVEVPTVIGWLRPVVLLPIASLSGLSTQQIEMVLAHELAHIRRHDFIVNLLQSVIETLLFYHPAVWWISQRIRIEREHCCDDLAVAVFGDPLQYARALTRFEELRLTAAQTSLAANGGSLLSRIRRLVAARAESSSWSSRWAAGAALLTVVAIVFAVPVFANHDEMPQAPPKAKVKAATPAPPPPAKPKPATACATAPQAVVDVDANGDIDVDSPDPAPEPVIAPRIATIVGDAVRESVAPAIAMVAPQIGVIGGIEGGIEGGIKGGIRTGRHRHIGEGGKLTVDDLIELRTAGVTSKYIDEMRSAGLGDLSLDDIVNLRMMSVTPAYIREMADAGYPHLSARELMELRTMSVTPAFVKSLADAGYKNLSLKDLVNLKASGVDANFIRDLAKYRSQ